MDLDDVFRKVYTSGLFSLEPPRELIAALMDAISRESESTTECPELFDLLQKNYPDAIVPGDAKQTIKNLLDAMKMHLEQAEDAMPIDDENAQVEIGALLGSSADGGRRQISFSDSTKKTIWGNTQRLL